MHIRILKDTDAAEFWDLRMEALETEPRAFFESAEEFRALPIETLIARLSGGGDDSFVMGAFDGDRLIGTAGFVREQRLKARHKGRVWGMYVTADARGRQVGRALLDKLIACAHTLQGLEQIMLSVTQHQTAAKKLYESVGFSTWGHEPNSLHVAGESLDEDYMVLRLK